MTVNELKALYGSELMMMSHGELLDRAEYWGIAVSKPYSVNTLRQKLSTDASYHFDLFTRLPQEWPMESEPHQVVVCRDELEMFISYDFGMCEYTLRVRDTFMASSDLDVIIHVVNKELNK